MKPNPGHLPEEATGKRVRVRLVRHVEQNLPGFECPAEGRGSCSWAIEATAFDVAEYQVL